MLDVSKSRMKFSSLLAATNLVSVIDLLDLIELGLPGPLFPG